MKTVQSRMHGLKSNIENGMIESGVETSGFFTFYNGFQKTERAKYDF